MAKIQFNCRLAQETVDWITKEAEKRSTKAKKWSQADVVALLVNRASVGLNGIGAPRKATVERRPKEGK